MFVDEENRSNIFHGVNVVYKQYPYIPDTNDNNWDPFFSLNEKDTQLMKQMGFNIVRLGIVWESVERQQGVYDMDYLAKMEEIVNNLGEHGIVTIIDAHQDMFSRIYCGEGVPIFYAKELEKLNLVDKKCDSNLLARFYKLLGVCIPLSNYNWEYEESGVPKIEYCKKNFINFHLSPELTTAYQAFYQNALNLQDKFVEFWKIVANQFKSNKYVIGLDYWNEPWPGDLFMDIRSFIPGYTDRKHLIPFYRKIDEEVRKIKKDYIIMLETVPFPDTLPFYGGHTVGGFEEPPLGQDKLEYQALNLHSYCCMAKGDACVTGEPTLEDSKTLCVQFHKRKIAKNKIQATKLGIPFMVTEFGACSNSEACFNEIKGFTNAADDNLVSWMYWMYKPFGDHTTSARENEEGMFLEDGNPQNYKIQALTRTYVQAYQGTPIKTYFDYDTGFFITSFNLDLKIKAPSILYYNKDLFYKNFTKNYTLRIFNENNSDLNCDINEYFIKETKFENYLQIKIKANNEYFKKISSSAYHKQFHALTSALGIDFVYPTVFIGIIPKPKIDTSAFDQNKKLSINIDNSSSTVNLLTVKSNSHTNIRIDIKIDYFEAENHIIQHLKSDHQYTISQPNGFIKTLDIETTYGNIRIENLFNNVIEISLD